MGNKKEKKATNFIEEVEEIITNGNKNESIDFDQEDTRIYLYFITGGVHTFTIGKNGVRGAILWPNIHTVLIYKEDERRFYSGVQMSVTY